ncbi:MAG: argininosuccinate lyase, partial [Alphaproteobacteria bacterium]|nr:argininosuccinate lyase [Alphaproteobacteria bacterium]
ALLIVMKGLPMTYGKDMQEDKEVTFDAADSLSLCVAAMAGMVEDMEPRPDFMRAALVNGFPTATDLADWCVRVLNMPFRDAHHVTGSLVAMAEEKECGLEELSLEDMQKVEARITEDVFSVLSSESSVTSRTSYGGTAPENVRAMAKEARSRFLA